MSATTDPNSPGLKEILEDGQQKDYLVLSLEERDRGFVRPLRDEYLHLKCGTITWMGGAIAETYARNPHFYGGTYCGTCRGHFPLFEQFVNNQGETMRKPNFYWKGTTEGVGE